MAPGRDFVMREKDFGIEIRDKTGRVEYVERATFSIELLKHVDAGLDSGFLCRIYCSLREQDRYGNCYKYIHT